MSAVVMYENVPVAVFDHVEDAAWALHEVPGSVDRFTIYDLGQEQTDLGDLAVESGHNGSGRGAGREAAGPSPVTLFIHRNKIP